MTYKIIFSREAEKQLSKLDKNARTQILCVLERCRIRPYAHMVKVIGTEYLRIRAGDYRIIVRIENEKLVILVVKVGHRKNIYERI